MDPFGKNELLSFYNRHLRDFGDAPQALRWTPEGQRRRYEALLEIAGDISGKEILDFGCGKGDFYGFIRDRGLPLKYCGIDINENLIELAGNKYPEAEFVAVDIEEAGIERRFDAVFLCGVFNLRVAGIEETMKNVLKNLFRLCREVLHINLLSYYTVPRDVELFYVKPEEILEFTITRLSSSVILRHGIVKGDIFVSIYKP